LSIGASPPSVIVSGPLVDMMCCYSVQEQGGKYGTSEKENFPSC
jgi:hypothetical protein